MAGEDGEAHAERVGDQFTAVGVAARRAAERDRLREAVGARQRGGRGGIVPGGDRAQQPERTGPVPCCHVLDQPGDGPLEKVPVCREGRQRTLGARLGRLAQPTVVPGEVVEVGDAHDARRRGQAARVAAQAGDKLEHLFKITAGRNDLPHFRKRGYLGRTQNRFQIKPGILNGPANLMAENR